MSRRFDVSPVAIAVPCALMVVAIGCLLGGPSIAVAGDSNQDAIVSSVAPADGTSIRKGHTVTFTATATGARDISIALGSSPVTRAGSLIHARWAARATRNGDGSFSWSPGLLDTPRDLAGTYYWQARADVYNADGTWQKSIYSPVRMLQVTMPAAWLVRGPIPRNFGRHGSGRVYASRSAIVRGVSPARFFTLVRISAPRWGFRFGGWTLRRPGVRDGRDVVGFANPVGRALGDTMYLSQSEGDIRLRPNLKWFAGPGFPAFNQYDVETVLVHELGHLARNRAHAPRCSRSPLAAGNVPGEWWHTPQDWLKKGCSKLLPVRDETPLL